MNTKGLKGMVIVLAILNIALIITIWFLPNTRGERKHGMPEGGPAKMIIAELNLNEEQIKKFEVLKNEHRSQVNKLREEGKKLRDDFFEGIKIDNLNDSISNAKSDVIAANQKAIELVTFNHFKKVRALCDAEQKKKFDEIIGDILRKMAGPPHPPGGPPHGQGPPPPPMH